MSVCLATQREVGNLGRLSVLYQQPQCIYFQGILELSCYTAHQSRHHILQTDGNHFLSRKVVGSQLGLQSCGSSCYRFLLHKMAWLRWLYKVA